METARSPARTVYIETKNIAGGLGAGIPFHLAVICPQAANARIAVVGASGLPSRGSPLTSSFRPSAGQYTLATSLPLLACAVIATRGSVNTSVPFDAATVEITVGPAPTPPASRSASCCSSAATWSANPSTPP